MEFNPKTIGITDGAKTNQFGFLTTPYGPTQESDLFVPYFLLIPLIKTIRIPFELILDAVIDFDSVLEAFRADGSIDLPERIEWDIHLIKSNQFKEKIIENPLYGPEVRKQALIARLPRFVWRAKASVGERDLLDLLFDTTDIEQGELLSKIVAYDLEFWEQVKSCTSAYESLPEREEQMYKPVGNIWRYLEGPLYTIGFSSDEKALDATNLPPPPTKP